MRLNPSFSVGIEEEYLLVDPETGDLSENPPQEIFDECERRLPNLIKPEFLKSQIESNTPVCKSVPEARARLAELRSTVSEIARAHDCDIIAASTHPFSQWQKQHHTDRERYNILANDLQAVVRRLLICGMHVHVGIDDDELRIDLLNQVVYFLPHILSLSTSSPFWQGENTGLMSYRLSVFDELPRTGIPNTFDSFAEYQRHVASLINAGLIEDASKLWWDIRPSQSYPTLEMRIADVCTSIDDAAAIAALFSCLLRMLYRLKLKNQRWRHYASMLIAENRWRAQRYGTDEGLVDFGIGEIVPLNQLVEEIIELISEDADALGCTKEIHHLRTILRRGTSAHRQRDIYETGIREGKETEQALKDVVDFLREETMAGA